MKTPPLPNADNLAFVDALYSQYLEDPSQVDAQWHDYLQALKEDDEALAPGRPLDPQPNLRSIFNPSPAQGAGSLDLNAADRLGQTWRLVNAFRVRGHMLADLDPIKRTVPQEHTELGISHYGFKESDLDQDVPSGGFFGASSPLKLRDLVASCKETYSRAIGVEFMNINSQEQKLWLAERMEVSKNRRALTQEQEKGFLKLLINAESMEQFIHTKYPGTKRFSLEGGEGVIPLLTQILEDASETPVEETVIGMAHRGRLNILVNVIGKEFTQLFEEFEDIDPKATLGSGDVKYHLGYSIDKTLPNDKVMHLSLTSNPSHLEAVNPVVEGRARAKQDRRRDTKHETVMPILIHGDAAFIGQGIVAETFNLSELTGYRTGGTIHVVINNHIGFTTSPSSSRSTAYATDMARMMQVPIFHVNGEDPESLATVAKIAVDFRHRFQKDVVIDMHCYRKYGHNEMDEPSFTQPLVYAEIKQHSSPLARYTQELVSRGVVTAEEVDAYTEDLRGRMEAALTEVRDNSNGKHTNRQKPNTLGGIWEGYSGGSDADIPEVDTGVDIDTLRFVTERMTSLPDDFNPHPKAKRLLDRRRKMVDSGEALDWAMGELLAYGSLMLEGKPVRISGQDSRRGTFSHRHAVLTDVKNGSEHFGLAKLKDSQAPFFIFDSSLSEAGVLGFEFGYSLDFPEALVIWEAQFGDFVNGAQIIIDQFITSSEDKWNRLSGLTMLLPHGYEGQGPEHSSAHLERFLQSCAEDNMQVANPTEPANFFHLLRRQVHRPLRKPLIVMSPKSLLRHPKATSTLKELTRGRFQKVIDDPRAGESAGESALKREDITRVILCSGKFYYELSAIRDDLGLKDTAIVRMELLYPLPESELMALLKSYPNVKAVHWAQEEPWNMGAWHHILTRTQSSLADYGLKAFTRPESASPATGSHKAHLIESCMLMAQIFGDDAQETAKSFYKVDF